MKKGIFMSAAAIALLAGCTGEPLPMEDGQEITIEAVMAENNDTRTVIQDGTASVLWEPGDEVKLFLNGTGSRLSSTLTEPAGVSSFSGTFNGIISFNEGFTDSTPLWGLYPYRSDATSDNMSVTTTLPAGQTGREGSFAKNTFITLATSQSLRMGFYNVCGGVRFTLTQEGVKEVVFQGQDDEEIAGRIKLVFNDGVPAVQEVTEGQKSITLTAPDGGTFETGKWYYIVSVPRTLGKGFRMTFNTARQYAVKESSSPVTIKRGVFGSLENADEGLTFMEKGSDDPMGTNIVFKDNVAKFACADKFDKDGDGEVSIAEAEAATSFEGLFTNWKNVESFDEIRYFKNVTSISGLFSDCSKLVSITVPDNITDLGTSAFSGCSSLTTVVLSSNITDIGSYTFQKCSNLTSIDIPSKVTDIGDYSFYGCSRLSSIDIPSKLTSIGSYAFYECSRLASIDIPSKVTSIGDYAFGNCSSLESTVLPNDLTSIGEGAFVNCTSLNTISIPDKVTSIPKGCFSRCYSLTSVTIPEGVTSIGDYAFRDIRIWGLELPTSVTSLGSSCFENIICVVLPSSSTVSIKIGAFSKVKAIFVPSGLIERYKLMTNWTGLSRRLRPLGSYREKDDFTLGTSGYVDMGVSVKWAAYNVGATRLEEDGGHFQWAGTEDVSDRSINLDLSKCPYHTGSTDKTGWTKYVPSDNATYWSGQGEPDNKTVLDPEDDVAHVKWGGNWRTPTDVEWAELKDACLWEWTSHEGKSGRMVYSFETGNKIFLPAAGYRSFTELNGIVSKGGPFGYYWSSALMTNSPYNACVLRFGSDSELGGYVPGEVDNNISQYRYYGLSVRPVSE